MASPVIRGRIAPVALLVALTFVIVGFLRADREMTHAERDRAELAASETATLVEAFVLRRVTELQTISARVIEAKTQNSSEAAESLSAIVAHQPVLGSHFERVWLVDSVVYRNSLAPLTASHDSALDNKVVAQLLAQLNTQQRATRDPLVVFGGYPEHRLLMFLAPFDGPVGAQKIIGLTSIDSLAALFRSKKLGRSFNVVVATPSDTVVAIRTELPNNAVTRVARLVRLPDNDVWEISIAYVPSGRGVRIALWIVGFSAVIGLGIGLVLERREANRIADRSSELEHLSTELLRANRAKSEFLANVSHELRTPLNAIVGFVDLLRDGVYGPLNARQTGPVERIEASANHLRHLVDQVLDLAKMAAGRLEVHSEPLELRPFVFDVASEVEPLMTEKGLSFSLAVGASLPRVRTDPTHLRQILVNLLGNAVKFTTHGGISIRGKLVKRSDAKGELNRRSVDLLIGTAKAETLWVALQVADSGVGIAPKDCERIFDEFEQVNAGPRGDSIRRGTGLGLSISRRLARLLGGDITVESELGRGSVFTVWLPVEAAEANGDDRADSERQEI